MFVTPPCETKVTWQFILQSTPIFRTADSAKQKQLKMLLLASQLRPCTKPLRNVGKNYKLQECRNCPKSLADENYHRTGHSKDQNILYSVMLQCKLTDGTSDAFVCDLKAAPDPQCIMALIGKSMIKAC